ncbi:MAG: MBL fold metallo-hydrolase [Desulfobacterales bacterium]|jgi:L-ascorbate metabolism protein UlaG (beta-lactamase superfamily)
MEIQLIRNATMKINYAGKTVLTDPMLSPKAAIDSFAGVARNPIVELPLPVEQILDGIEGVIVSHGHPDHFDSAASAALPKTIPVFCQPDDELRMAEEGFRTVIPIETDNVWNEITITRTGGRHGSGKILERMGNVSGFVLQADGEPTVYWVGDSIWCKPVQEAITRFNPEVVITHSGGATIPGFDPIIMDIDQTIATAKASPEAIIVAIHMEALDHCPISRVNLRQKVEKELKRPSRIKIPKDSEVIAF